MQNEASFKRGPIALALALAIVLVVGVLGGAKLVYEQVAHRPVAMTSANSPEAESPECASLLDKLPNKVLGHQRAELADPAPAGAAAWQSDSTHRVTLRCGVNLPLQYTQLSELSRVDETSWLEIRDTTPGSTFRTWYAVDRFPIVALTADDAGLGKAASPVAELSTAVASLQRKETQPHPLPLQSLREDANPHKNAHSSRCTELISDLPEHIGESPQYSRRSVSGLPDGSAVWSVQGYEPIMVRCGVAFPSAYEAGAQIQQIDSVAWFEDTTLGNGTTASTWYALGREIVVAVSVPQNSGNAALVEMTKIIEKHTAESPVVR
ncbi:DUF3515 family protein [Corynebacterium pseudotuberculosis]|uniref:DUF3515 domain-containing protein n=1 Tax=Corynebacterium pseudotuberculosis TaxID=1719 RepID=UPI0007DB27D9|nr:DUF3515 domain-containing protein [Corynebacterium pseudotuberculosis]ANH26495.1 Hypothetical protein CpMEX9_1746 [Corynebacterium pseudotuberculosis]APZ32450.1 Hypothetical protein CpMEX1_1741 [Corynebacterium pseudotuberculosis]QGX59726.1 DUF3515 family protein [Corynebacterium pseudotuberculosis]